MKQRVALKMKSREKNVGIFDDYLRDLSRIKVNILDIIEVNDLFLL